MLEVVFFSTMLCDCVSNAEFLKTCSKKRKGGAQEHTADDPTRLGSRPGELDLMTWESAERSIWISELGVENSEHSCASARCTKI